MILLDTTELALGISLGTVVSSKQFDYVCSWENDAGSITYSSADGNTRGTTLTTLIPHPTAGTKIKLLFLSVVNTDTVLNTVYVELITGTSSTGSEFVTKNIFQAILKPNYSLIYDIESGFRVYDNTGAEIISAPTGVVTSVGLADGSTGPIYLITGSPVLGAGTLTFTLKTQTANTVFAGPASGPVAQPSFRTLVPADLPAGTGTVTNVSSGNFSPLFTVSIANPTTTPAISFSAISQAQNLFYASPNGGAGNPSFRSIVNADLPVSGVTAGTYNTVTVNAQGIVTNGSNASYLLNTLTNTHIFVGNAGNIATDVAMSGDTTISNTGAVTIGNNKVTYAKMQQASTVTLLGNPTGGAANIQEITLGAGLSFTGSVLNTVNNGTVTSFSAGNLSPLFTTSVATATTTPALSFSLSNASAYTIFGNNTNASAGPTFFAPVLASALYANQGTTTQVLHGNAAGNPSWGQVVTGDIATNNVTYAKIQQASTVTLLGNPTNGTANVQEITLGAGLSFSGSVLNTVNSGTVTSVAMTVPGFLSVSGSPITTSGTFAVTLATQSANLVFAGPSSGAAATPTFRSLVAADLPGSFSGFANPTASVGLTTVNGTATTAMRSDGAPPLDQSIAPTWTGKHIFNTVGTAIRVGTTTDTAWTLKSIMMIDIHSGNTVDGLYISDNTNSDTKTPALILGYLGSGTALGGTNTFSGGIAFIGAANAIVSGSVTNDILIGQFGIGSGTGRVMFASAGTKAGFIDTSQRWAIGANIPTTNGKLQTQAGGSTANAKVGGVIFQVITDTASTASTAEQTLTSQAVSASSLTNNGDSIFGKFAGTFNTTGGVTKRLKLYFGPNGDNTDTLVYDSGALTISAVSVDTTSWNIVFDIQRDTSSSCRVDVYLVASGASLGAPNNYVLVSSLTLTNAQKITLTSTSGTGAAANDVILKKGIGEWRSAA